MARSRPYSRTSAAGASLPRPCNRAGDGQVTGSRQRANAQTARGANGRRLIGQDRRQASDQAERWSLVTRPVTRRRAVSAAQALYPWSFAAAELRNPGRSGPRRRATLDLASDNHQIRPPVGGGAGRMRTTGSACVNAEADARTVTTWSLPRFYLLAARPISAQAIHRPTLQCCGRR